MAGDDETGVTIHRTVKELDAGPIAAQEAFPIGPDDDAGAVFARAAEVAADLLDEVLENPAPEFVPQSEDGVTYADKIGPADRELDLDGPAEELVRRVRALSPHIGARAELRRPPDHGLARARGGGRRLRADRGAARRRQAHGCGGLAARPPVTAREISPARAAAFDVVRRVFEDEAYADRALRGGRGEARRPRPGARPAARVRHRAAGADARPRDRGARPPPRAPPRRAGAGGAPARRLPARVPRRRPPLRGRERVGGARAPGAARARRPVHERGAPAPRRRGARARRGAPGLDLAGGGAQALLPRLGRRDVVARPRPRRRPRADAGPERGAADSSSGSSAARSRARPIRTSPVPGASSASTRTRSPRAGSGRRAPARSWPGSRSAPSRGSACSTSARRPAGRRRCSRGEVVAVEANEARARELEENVRRLGRRTSPSSTPTAVSSPWS